MLWVLAAVLTGGCGYNQMQRLEENVFKAWGDVESNLQRRADLIPNLVETVKGYAAHERETLEAVVNARAKATSVTLSPGDLGDAAAMQRLQAAQGALSSALARLLVVVERYPNLKANQNFLDLQNQLEGTENRINVAALQPVRGVVQLFDPQISQQPDEQLSAASGAQGILQGRRGRPGAAESKILIPAAENKASIQWI